MICAMCLLYLFGGEFDTFSFNLLLLGPEAENCYFPYGNTASLYMHLDTPAQGKGNIF